MKKFIFFIFLSWATLSYASENKQNSGIWNIFKKWADKEPILPDIPLQDLSDNTDGSEGSKSMDEDDFVELPEGNDFLDGDDIERHQILNYLKMLNQTQLDIDKKIKVGNDMLSMRDQLVQNAQKIFDTIKEFQPKNIDDQFKKLQAAFKHLNSEFEFDLNYINRFCLEKEGNLFDKIMRYKDDLNMLYKSKMPPLYDYDVDYIDQLYTLGVSQRYHRYVDNIKKRFNRFSLELNHREKMISKYLETYEKLLVLLSKYTVPANNI